MLILNNPFNLDNIFFIFYRNKYGYSLYNRKLCRFIPEKVIFYYPVSYFVVEIIPILRMINYNYDTEFVMNDFPQTIIKYLVILILIYIALKFIIPMILQLIGMILIFIIKIIMWGAIIVVLYLLGNFIYQSHKNNG